MELVKNPSHSRDAERWVTLKEIGDYLDLTEARISQIAKSLKLKRPDARGYPLKLFIRTYVTWLRGRVKAGTKAGAAQRKQLEDRLLAVKVQNAELDFQERVGAVTIAADVESSALKEGKRVRDAFMRLGARIASELATESDAHAVRLRIDEEVAATLQDLSREDDEEPGDDA